MTAATYIILYDHWWNPAVEAQATGRTHRISQQNANNAYRLTIKDCVEDKIQSLKLKKETLATEVIQEDSLHKIINLDCLKLIFQLQLQRESDPTSISMTAESGLVTFKASIVLRI